MKYLKLLALTILGVLCCNDSYAYDFEVDGMYYNILSNNSVEITRRYNNGGSYSGELTIPTSVGYNGQVYSVVSIGNYAFSYCSITGTLTIPNTVVSIGIAAFLDCSSLTGSLTIPNSVTHIGDSAFLGCSGFTGSLTISSSVTYIGNHAFEGCGGFTGSLTIPSSVTYLGNHAFSGCSSFTGSLTIPSSVTSIAEAVFSNCRGFTGSLTIPSSVTSIGGYAFSGCSGFTGSLIIPNSVKSIGTGAFSGCNRLTGSLTISNSVTYIGNEVFCGCSGLTGVLTIPNTVTFIGNSAFSQCSGFTGSLTIPSSVTSIKEGTFNNCRGLTDSLTIPNSVKSIGGAAFYGCKQIKLVVSKILSPFDISDNVFSNLDAVLQVPKGTKSKYQALSGWNNSFKEIREEVEGTHVLSITASGNGSASYVGTTVRDRTSTLNVVEGSSVTVSFTPDSGYRIASVIVNGVDVTSSVSNSQYTINSITANTTLSVTFEVIPPMIHTLSVTSSGNGSVSFAGTSVRGTTSTFNVIDGSSATVSFTPDSGYRIASVIVNGVDVTLSVSNSQYTIGSITANTTLLVTFEAIPSIYTLSVTSSGNGSASYAGTTVRDRTSTLNVVEGSSVTISFTPDSGYRIASVIVNGVDVTSSVSNSQYTINSITANTTLSVTFEVIPPMIHTLSVTSSGNGSVSFAGTSVRGATSTFNVIDGSSATVLFTPDSGYRIASVIVNGVDVTSGVANNQYTISSITANTTLSVTFEVIPPTIHTLSVTSSGNGSVSFAGTSVRGTTSTFNVIDGTSATVSFTPDEDARITSVKVNDTDVTSSVVNNQYTINNVTSDLSVNVVFESNRFEVNSIYYNILSGNSVEITYCKRNYSGEFIIPNSVEYNGKVYDVVSIGEEAFEDCSGLTGSLTIPSSVTKIGDNAFCGCSGFTGSLTIPNSVTFIGEGAFYNCRGLTGSLTIPNSVTSIGFIAFCGCSGFTGSLTIPNSVTSIGESAFSRCSGLTGSLIIPSSVKSIGEEAFAECRFTGSLTIPNSVVSIGKSAFYQCNGFTGSLTIPNSLTSIGHRAFIGCSGFELVISEILSPSNISNETLLLYNPNAVLQVPKGTKSKYQALNGWICNFKEIREEGEEENITALDAEGVNYMVVSQAERTIQVAAGDYGQVLTVPATVSAQGLTWQVTGIEKDALKDNANLAAVIWEPEVAFTATVSNPNLLLYVKDEQYAQSDVKNVVVNGTANSVVLVEAAAGNSFYCPQAFTAHQISYTHNYQMQTGIGEAKGWETLALPFDVQSITHQEKGNIVPFASRNGSDERPFWLYELTGSGFVEAGSIKAYTPYIISMPNHPQYYDQWLLRGNVTFAASDVIVGVTSDVRTVTYGNRTFVPCFTEKGSNEGLYAMNVNNDYVVNSSGMTEGSKFVLNMRSIHPFEAYMTTTSANPQYSFGIFDGMATKVSTLEIGDLLKDETYYDLQGRKTIAPTKKGVYITNGRKKVIK